MSNKTLNVSFVKTALAPKPTFWVVASLFLLLLIWIFPPAIHAVNCYNFQRNHPYHKDIRIDFPGQPINAEIVDTEAGRELGLSGRTCMHRNQAMLFVFDVDDVSNHCFWMKDMKFPLDIYWLDKDRHVVYAATGLSPETYPRLYCSEVQSRYVLEFASGIGHEVLLNYNTLVPFSTPE